MSILIVGKKPDVPRAISWDKSKLKNSIRLGSIERSIFTLVGNRIKGRRACWSIAGSNRLAALLCKITL